MYNRHRRWSGDGTWAKVLAELRRDADREDGEDWAVAVDAGIVRAHQHAAGARKLPPADIDPEVLAGTRVAPRGPYELQENRAFSRI